MNPTHALHPTVASLQIGERLRDAEEARVRRLARRSAQRRGWSRSPRTR